MQIETTMGAIGAATGVLRAIGDRDPTTAVQSLLALRVPVAEALARMEAAAIIEQKAELLAKMEAKLAQEHGGNKLNPEHPNWDKHIAAASELRATRVTLEITPIKVANLGAGEVSPRHLALLQVLGWVAKVEPPSQLPTCGAPVSK